MSKTDAIGFKDKDGQASAPLLSIGLPVYNDEEAIGTAIEDLLSQSFRDVEIIISDNASIDKTGEICRAFAARDDRIRYIRQRENLGAKANFQFVLSEARGKYFFWAASDDRRDLEFARFLVGRLEESEENASAFCCFANIDQRGNDIAHFAFDFSARTRFFQIIKFLFAQNGRKDVFIYGIHRLRFLREAKFYTWWGANSITPFHLAYPILVYLLAKGNYIHVNHELFFSRMFPGRGNRYPVAYENRRILRLVARNSLEVNAHWAMFASVWRASRSLLTSLLLVPFVVASLLLVLLRVNTDAFKQLALRLKGSVAEMDRGS